MAELHLLGWMLRVAQRLLIAGLGICLFAGLVVRETSAQVPADDPQALYQQVIELYRSGNIAGTAPLLERYVQAIKERDGDGSLTYAAGLNDLGTLYQTLGRYDDAERPLLLALDIRKSVLGEESLPVAQTLNGLAAFHLRQGRFARAVTLFEQALAIRERLLGAEHPDVATVMSNLAFVYKTLGRFDETERLYTRSLAMREKALGPEHADVAIALNNLAELYRTQGRYDDAAPLYERALAIREKALGVEHPTTAESLVSSAALHFDRGQYPAAEQKLKRALEIFEKSFGAQHPNLATVLNNLAELYRTQGRYTQAAPLYRRALDIRMMALGEAHPDVAISVYNLARMVFTQGEYTKAEPLMKQALTLFEKALGSEHQYVGISLNTLAEIYRLQGRYTEAEPLFKRSLAVLEKALGAEHKEVATILNNLGVLYGVQGRYDEVTPLLERSLAIRKKAAGPESIEVVQSHTNLGEYYVKLDEFDKAEMHLKRAVALSEKILGTEHPDLSTALNNLGALYYNQQRHEEAEPVFSRALGIRERILGTHHPDVALSLNNLAFNHVARQQSQVALALLRRSVQMLIDLERLAGDAGAGALAGERPGAQKSLTQSFVALVKLLSILDIESHGTAQYAAGEAFVAAQWAQNSGAATALAQMAVRFSAQDSSLGSLIRDRQDLVGQWRDLDRRLISAVSEVAEKRIAATETQLRADLERISEQIADIDRTFDVRFPGYTELAHPEPLSIAEIKPLISKDEALLLFLDAPAIRGLPAEVIVWAITGDRTDWASISLAPEEVIQMIRGLRSDFALNGAASPLLEVQLEAVESANRLYQSLLGPVADVIVDRDLLIVPSGSLTSLPWHLLVTEAPETANAKPSWLVRKHAVTVLPSVSSLVALRRTARQSLAQKPFIGIGNPLLLGPSGKDVRALRFASCADWKGEVEVTELRAPGPIRSLFRGAVADVEKVRHLAPLPRTAGELCAVAGSLGMPESQILMGTDAMETRVKALSAQGSLDDYRVVHFATHGLVAGDLDGLAEPSLVLTPPETASDEDDGLLTASEVTQLKLDADWVVLSACNTAAGETGTAEALSGLARAFFYAGARALLVSHWPVNSQAAVELTTGTFSELKAEPGISRAEALRRAMLALIDSGERQKAHPSYWAPFVVVGQP